MGCGCFCRLVVLLLTALALLFGCLCVPQVERRLAPQGPGREEIIRETMADNVHVRGKIDQVHIGRAFFSLNPRWPGNQLPSRVACGWSKSMSSNNCLACNTMQSPVFIKVLVKGSQLNVSGGIVKVTLR